MVSNFRVQEEGIQRPYYGMNISRGREPLDQLDFLFLAKKLGVPITIFIAGQYGILNGGKTDPLELAEKENAKRRLLEAVLKVFGVEGTVLTTPDLWLRKEYWEAVLDLFSIEGIIEKGGVYSFSKAVEKNPSVFPNCQEFVNALELIGNFPASGLYTLLEVAEARFLQREYGIDCKFGPVSEERYDRFIEQFMGIVQLYQPLDLRASVSSPKIDIPYMERLQEERIFFGDSKQELMEKLGKAAQRATKTKVFWETEAGTAVNPFVRYLIYAIEAADLSDNLPVRIRNRNVRSSEAAVETLEKSEGIGLSEIVGSVGEAIWNYIIKPIERVVE
ncbi:MAG: hypothetical protein PHU63_00775 [Candidatus ainarchaeum sp.]|nr:hypothetical protein [Candidatus ainarchaeum sp.]